MKYKWDILPTITLLGIDGRDEPHKNLHRTSNDHIFYIITDGEMHFEEDGTEYTLKKGDCFLFEAGKTHRGLVESRYKLIYIHFNFPACEIQEIDDEQWINDAEQKNILWSKANENDEFPDDNIYILKHFCIDMDTLDKVTGEIKRIIERKRIKLEMYPFECSAAIAQLFIRIYRVQIGLMLNKTIQNSSPRILVDDIVSYMQRNLSRKLSRSIIEKELRYNFDYINQCLRKRLNTSFFKMLEEMRMDDAKTLLITTDLSISEISDLVGYSDETYFSKRFKGATKCTPTQYRKQSK